ncbi:CFI-box-CTERM domain-containing protein [Bacillus paramobilis]|uniref:CFI-box-CTERM domain-containing protein n=1 Tax=Bacillus paramobilis TaxID=2817477 RepID=UPI003D1D543D
MVQPNETFDLLSKLLTEKMMRLTPEQKSIRQKYDELYEHVTKQMARKLDASVYEGKTNLMLQLEQLLKRIEFFTRFPKVANTKIVTVYGSAKEAKHFFEQILSPEDVELIRMNTNVPTIIYRDEQMNDIHSLNTLGNMETLEVDDYKEANTDLYKKNVDIRRLIQLYQLATTDTIHNTTFVYLPKFSLKEQEMYSLLHQLGESTIIFIDEKGMWKREVQTLLKYRQVKEIHLLASTTELDEVQQFATQIADCIVVHAYEADMYEWFETMDTPSYNTAFEELINEHIMIYSTSIEALLQQQNRLIQNMRKDILNTSDEEAAELLRTLSNKLKKENKDVKNNHETLMQDIQTVMDLAKQLDSLICSQTNVKHSMVTKTTPYITKHMVSLILSLIDNDDLTNARRYIVKLEKLGFGYIRAFDIYIKSIKGSAISAAELDYIKRNGLQQEISRIQLKLWTQLQMDLDILHNLQDLYGKSYDPNVLYELGLAYECTNEVKKAQDYYWRAANLGQFEAAKRLINYVDKNNIRDMEKLADLMIPEANYYVGMYYLHKDRGYKKAVAALKMAAAYEHMGAIKELSKLEYINYVKVRKKDADKAANMLDSLIFLHQYLMDNGEGDEDISERLGKLFYWNKYFRKAEPLLERCNTAEAQFLCGKIYQYGNDYAQDLPKAKMFFERAKELGHPYANNEYRKVEGWIQSNQSKERYSATRSYASTSYTSSSSSSSKKGCFLTTATCVALDKPDNCEEIMAYKAYRDNNLAKDGDGEPLIIEYYRIAPLLVETIDAKPNAKEIYIYLYNKYIKVGYAYLQKKDMRQAKKTYIDMVRELCEKYEIEPLIKDEEIQL